MNNSFAFFLPTRKGSERVPNKNTKSFAGIEGGLVRLKLKQLLAMPLSYPIYISTNDPATIEVADSFASDRIQIVERPDRLCQSGTVIQDFINYIPTVVPNEHIFWVHATAPFVDEKVLMAAYEEYLHVEKSGFSVYDSLMSVTKIQQFLWDAESSDFINHDRSKVKWPRTQDLKPLFEINHAFYINSRDNYLKFEDRIGQRPYPFELDRIASFDIDWPDDFKLAEIIYHELYR